MNQSIESLSQKSMSKNVLHKMNIIAPKAIQLDFIIKEIGARMMDRLDYIKVNAEHVLDIGYGLGVDRHGLHKRYPKSAIYGVDIALNMLKTYAPKKSFTWLGKLHKNLICADALNLPIASQSMDLVWSNLTLPYIMNIKQYFAEINRVLKLGATFLVSGLGVDSLVQLRELGLATYNFPDMHLIGDTLVELGFSNPVTDLEYITLEYNTLDDLLSDIRIIGCGAVLRHHLNRAEYVNLQHNFDRISGNGKFPLTLEIFYAHAWKDKIRSDLVSGRSVIQFQK
ncbi:MAG TPA: methyltransferase domain-containing protein [Aquella sp.]|nr:methyltransferase domain-containing protein [Aquella sp.]